MPIARPGTDSPCGVRLRPRLYSWEHCESRAALERSHHVDTHGHSALLDTPRIRANGHRASILVATPPDQGAPPRQLRGKPLTDFLRRVQRPDVDLVFVLQDMQDPINVGSAFRIADACGVRRMILTGITTCPPHPLIKKVGRGRERRVKWEYAEDAPTAVDELRGEGYRVTAVEITGAAMPYDTADYGERVALVVGHEDHGVTNRTLSSCDQTVFLPMHGKGASLNVHVSLGIVAYHVLSLAAGRRTG